MSEPAGLRARAGGPAPPRIARFLSVLALAASSLCLASCQEQRAFGMAVPELRGILAGNDAAPILGLDDRSLGDPGKYGPAGGYYLALWIESRAAPAPMPMRLLRLAYDGAGGIVKARAAGALLARLGEAGDYEGLLKLADELDGAQSRDWKVRRARLAALDALGISDEALDEIDRLRIAFPEESAADADALACVEAAARAREGAPGSAARDAAISAAALPRDDNT